MSKADGKKDESFPFQFCALEYRPRGWGKGASSNAPVILLVLKDEKGGLRFLVSPDLRTIVQGDDWAYLDPLLLDIQKRAQNQPADLFKQLASLGVGPLVATEVGKALSDNPSLRELSDKFIDLTSRSKPKPD